MQDLYAENILDHYRHPRCSGRLPSPTVTHTEVNASCGDTLAVDLQIDDGRIVAVRWEGSGCAISQAGMSLLAEALEGRALDTCSALSPQAVRDLLGVPVGTRRFKCAFLGLHAVNNALRTHAGLPQQSWEETLRE